jgi:hypothetical protein
LNTNEKGCFALKGLGRLEHERETCLFDFWLLKKVQLRSLISHFGTTKSKMFPHFCFLHSLQLKAV